MDASGGESAQGVGRAGDSLEGEVKIMGAEKVFASTVRPCWKSSLADRPGKESVPISDPNSDNNQMSK